MEETISRIADADNGSLKTVAQLRDLATALGRPARQRSTIYESLCDEHRWAADCLDRSLQSQLPLVSVNAQEAP